MKTLLTLGAAAALIGTAAHAAEIKTGYAAANGLDYYYEISGEGEPLLLLHGGLGSTDMFKPVMPALTEHRQVIATICRGTAAPSCATARSTSSI